MKKIQIFSLLFFGLSHTQLYSSTTEVTLRKTSGPKPSNDKISPGKILVIRTLLSETSTATHNSLYDLHVLFPHSEYRHNAYSQNEIDQLLNQAVSLAPKDYEDFPNRR